MTSSTRRAVLGALAALAPVAALASPAFSIKAGAQRDVVGADLGDGLRLRLTRASSDGRRPLFLICGHDAQGPGNSPFAAECAAAGFAAIEVRGAPWSPDTLKRAMSWLDRKSSATIDASRMMAGAEGAGAMQALALADRVRAEGGRPIAGVVGLNARYGPGAAEIAHRVTRPYDSGERGASLLLLSHFDQAADTLELATALMTAHTPFQLQILTEDAPGTAIKPRRTLALARGFVGDGAPRAVQA